MDFQVVPEGRGRFILRCPEQLEWSARIDLVESLTAQCGQAPVEGIILDLQAVSYINSAGIGAIFALRKFALEHQAVVVVARCGPTIKRMLETVNLPELMPMVETLDQARDVLNASASKQD